MSKLAFGVVAILVALCFCGCSSTEPTLQHASAGELRAMAAAATSAPRLQRGDKIRIVVYGEDKVGGDYEIDPGGFVTMPLAGTVHAAGLTTAAFQRLLTKKLRSEYLKDPQVTVEVITFQPVYVMGEVERPGEYPFRTDLNVVTATALAGGVTYRGSRTTVEIRHAGEPAPREYPLAPTVPVFPGDTIKIPERYF